MLEHSEQFMTLFEKKEPSKPSVIINEQNIVIITKLRRMGARYQISECTSWSIEVDWISCLFKGSPCILALIQYVQEEQHSLILLNVKAGLTSWIAEWRSLALGCPSLLCQREIWAKLAEELVEACEDWWTWEIEKAMELDECKEDRGGIG